MAPKDDQETAALKKELADLISKFQVRKNEHNIAFSIAKLIVQILQEEQTKAADCKLEDKCSDLGDVPKVRLSTKRNLKGHINKVNSVHYAEDSRYTLIDDNVNC